MIKFETYRAEIEAKRRDGLQKLKEGQGHRQIAEALGVTRRTVRHWNTLYRRGGEEGLKMAGVGHRPSRLSAEQLQRLREMLLEGAVAHGFDTDLWTCPRVARLIKAHFDVHYHEDHVWKILHHKLGFSPQKPDERARERDEGAIRQWREERWPAIKKKPGKSMP